MNDDDDRFTPQLACDCGGRYFHIVRRDDDGLDVICLNCVGKALVIDLWEEHDEPSTRQETRTTPTNAQEATV